MISTTLSDGTIKHITSGWTGYQSPGQSMLKTKWYKDGTNYWRVKGSKTTYGDFCDKHGITHLFK